MLNIGIYLEPSFMRVTKDGYERIWENGAQTCLHCVVIKNNI